MGQVRKVVNDMIGEENWLTKVRRGTRVERMGRIRKWRGARWRELSGKESGEKQVERMGQLKKSGKEQEWREWAR